MPRPAVFLDRDGTLIEDSGYVGRLEDVRPIRGVGEALAALSRAGFALYVVTNQSGVGRGYFSMGDVDRIHAALARGFARRGAAIEAFLVCPCLPEAGCGYRKPSPRFVLETAQSADLDLGRSFFIGDSQVDIGAGRAAGVRTVLVRTGNGRRTEAEAEPRPDIVVDNLRDAAEWIVARQRKETPAGED